MPDATQYFAAIRAEKEKLAKLYPGGYLHIISTRNLNAGSVAGVVSEVSTRIAAKSICENVARIATADEVAEFSRQGAAFSARMATQSFDRKKSDSSGVTITLSK